MAKTKGGSITVKSRQKREFVTRKQQKMFVVGMENEASGKRGEDVTETKVYKTYDYNKFKLLDANRVIKKNKVKALVQSIKENGYILNPIAVNDNFEIIDGQHRYEALKQLGMPVQYYIIHGGTVENCIPLNINTSNWGQADYIHYYAEQGKVAYKYLKILSDQYKSKVGISAVLNAINPCWTDDKENRMGSKPKVNSAIRDGNFICTAEQYEKASEILEFESQFESAVRGMGKLNYSKVFMAIGFCYNSPKIDNTRLFKVLHSGKVIENTGTIEAALDEIVAMYNYRNRGHAKVYLNDDYKVYRDNK